MSLDATASAIRGGQADGPWDAEAPRALVADPDNKWYKRDPL